MKKDWKSVLLILILVVIAIGIFIYLHSKLNRLKKEINTCNSKNGLKLSLLTKPKSDYRKNISIDSLKRTTLDMLDSSFTLVSSDFGDYMFKDYFKNFLKTSTDKTYDQALKQAKDTMFRNMFAPPVFVPGGHYVLNPARQQMLTQKKAIIDSMEGDISDEVKKEIEKDLMNTIAKNEISTLEKGLKKEIMDKAEISLEKTLRSYVAGATKAVAGAVLGIGMDLIFNAFFPPKPSLTTNLFLDVINKLSEHIDDQFKDINAKLNTIGKNEKQILETITEGFKKLDTNLTIKMQSNIFQSSSIETLQKNINDFTKQLLWVSLKDTEDASNMVNDYYTKASSNPKVYTLCNKTFRCKFDVYCRYLNKIQCNQESIFTRFTGHASLSSGITTNPRFNYTLEKLPFYKKYYYFSKFKTRFNSDSNNKITPRHILDSIENDKQLNAIGRNQTHVVLNLFAGAGMAIYNKDDDNTSYVARGHYQKFNFQIYKLFIEMIRQTVESLETYNKIGSMMRIPQTHLMSFSRKTVAKLAFYYDCFVLTLRQFANITGFENLDCNLVPNTLPFFSTNPLEENISIIKNKTERLFIGSGWKQQPLNPDKYCCKQGYYYSKLRKDDGKDIHICYPNVDSKAIEEVNKCLDPDTLLTEKPFFNVNKSIQGGNCFQVNPQKAVDDKWTLHNYIQIPKNMYYTEYDDVLICPTSDATLTPTWRQHADEEIRPLNVAGRTCFKVSNNKANFTLNSQFGNYNILGVRTGSAHLYGKKPKFKTDEGNSNFYSEEASFGAGLPGIVTFGPPLGKVISVDFNPSKCPDVPPFPYCTYGDKSEQCKINIAYTNGCKQCDGTQQKCEKCTPPLVECPNSCNNMHDFCMKMKEEVPDDAKRLEYCVQLYNRCSRICDKDSKNCKFYIHSLLRHMLEIQWAQKIDKNKELGLKEEFAAFKYEIISQSVYSNEKYEDVEKEYKNLLDGAYDDDLINLLNVTTPSSKYVRLIDDPDNPGKQVDLDILVDVKYADDPSNLGKKIKSFFETKTYTDSTGKVVTQYTEIKLDNKDDPIHPYYERDSLDVQNPFVTMKQNIKKYKNYFDINFYDDDIMDSVNAPFYSICNIGPLGGDPANVTYQYWCKNCGDEEAKEGENCKVGPPCDNNKSFPDNIDSIKSFDNCSVMKNPNNYF